MLKNTLLASINKDYEDELGSDSEDKDIPEEKQEVVPLIEIKQIERNGDIEMKPQTDPIIPVDVFLGGYPIRDPFMKLAELTAEINEGIQEKSVFTEDVNQEINL